MFRVIRRLLPSSTRHGVQGRRSAAGVADASARSERDSFSCRVDRTYACSQLIITSTARLSVDKPISACWRGPPRINAAPRAVLKSSIRSVVRVRGRAEGGGSVWVKNSFSPCSCPTHYIRHLFSGHHVLVRACRKKELRISSER